MTREEAIKRYVIPACERMWNEKTCQKIMEILEEMLKESDEYNKRFAVSVRGQREEMSND